MVQTLCGRFMFPALRWGHKVQILGWRKIIMYLRSRWGQRVAVWIEQNCYSTPFTLSSFPPSLARSLLFSDHSSTAERHASHFDHHTGGGERVGRRKERDRQRMRQTFMQHAGHRGWCLRIWDLFQSSWKWQDRQLMKSWQQQRKKVKERGILKSAVNEWLRRQRWSEWMKVTL